MPSWYLISEMFCYGTISRVYKFWLIHTFNCKFVFYVTVGIHFSVGLESHLTGYFKQTDRDCAPLGFRCDQWEASIISTVKLGNHREKMLTLMSCPQHSLTNLEGMKRWLGIDKWTVNAAYANSLPRTYTQWLSQLSGKITIMHLWFKSTRLILLSD